MTGPGFDGRPIDRLPEDDPRYTHLQPWLNRALDIEQATQLVSLGVKLDDFDALQRANAGTGAIVRLALRTRDAQRVAEAATLVGAGVPARLALRLVDSEVPEPQQEQMLALVEAGVADDLIWGLVVGHHCTAAQVERWLNAQLDPGHCLRILRSGTPRQQVLSECRRQVREAEDSHAWQSDSTFSVPERQAWESVGMRHHAAVRWRAAGFRPYQIAAMKETGSLPRRPPAPAPSPLAVALGFVSEAVIRLPRGRTLPDLVHSALVSSSSLATASRVLFAYGYQVSATDDPLEAWDWFGLVPVVGFVLGDAVERVRLQPDGSARRERLLRFEDGRPVVQPIGDPATPRSIIHAAVVEGARRFETRAIEAMQLLDWLQGAAPNSAGQFLVLNGRLVGLDADPVGTAAWVPWLFGEWPEARRKRVPRSYGFGKDASLVTIGPFRFVDDPLSFDLPQFVGSFATEGVAFRSMLRELAQSPSLGVSLTSGKTLRRQGRRVVLSVKRTNPQGDVTGDELVVEDGNLVHVSDRGAAVLSRADRRGVRTALSRLPALGVVHRGETTRIEVATGWFDTVGHLADALRVGVPRSSSPAPDVDDGDDEIIDEWWELTDIATPDTVDPTPVFINGDRWAIADLSGDASRTEALLPVDGDEGGWLIPSCSHRWAWLSACEGASMVSGTAYEYLGLGTPTVAVAVSDGSSWGDVSVRAWSSSPKLRLWEIRQWIDTVNAGFEYRGGVNAYARQIARWGELRFAPNDTLELDLSFDASQDELRSMVDWENAEVWGESPGLST